MRIYPAFLRQPCHLRHFDLFFRHLAFGRFASALRQPEVLRHLVFASALEFTSAITICFCLVWVTQLTQLTQFLLAVLVPYCRLVPQWFVRLPTLPRLQIEHRSRLPKVWRETA